LFFTYCDETNDGTTGAPGGAAPGNEAPAGGDAAATGDVTATDAAAASTPKSPEEVRMGMREKIDELIDGNKPADPTAAADDKTKAADKAAADAKVDDKGKAKKDDKAKPDLHKMPDGLKPESQSRFRELSNEVKTLSKRAETAEAAAQQHVATVNGFRDILAETHTTAEDLSQLLEYNRMLKTGDLESALKFLDQQRSEIAHYLGRPVDGVDVLAAHPDLAEAVAAGQLTKEHAAELARGRAIETSLRAQNDRTQKERQTTQAKQKETDDAIAAIAKFASEKAAGDVDYKRKEEILLKAVDRIRTKFPPSLWLEQVELLYENMVIPPAPAPRQAGGANPPQPLRPNAAGGGKPKPRSMKEAIERGLNRPSA
jgi:hypothetical protein